MVVTEPTEVTRESMVLVQINIGGVGADGESEQPFSEEGFGLFALVGSCPIRSRALSSRRGSSAKTEAEDR